MAIPIREPRVFRRCAGAACGILLLAACTPGEKAAGNGALQPAPVSEATGGALAGAAVTPEAVALPPASAPVVGAIVVGPPPASATTRTPQPSVTGSVPSWAPPVTTEVRIDLPAGPGRETVQQVCTSCHAIGMVTANGRTSDGWTEVIERMMGFGIEASDEDLRTVHAYLTRAFPPQRAN